MMPIDAISEELLLKLKALDDDRDFVVGVMSFAKRIEDRKKLLEYINNGEDVTTENILLMALHLSQEAKQKTN